MVPLLVRKPAMLTVSVQDWARALLQKSNIMTIIIAAEIFMNGQDYKLLPTSVSEISLNNDFNISLFFSPFIWYFTFTKPLYEKMV